MEPAIRVGPGLLKAAAPGEPGVYVWGGWHLIHSSGATAHLTWRMFRVPVDFAGDLSLRPLGGYWCTARERHPLGFVASQTWEAWGVGFIEDEAMEALEAAKRAALASA